MDRAGFIIVVIQKVQFKKLSNVNFITELFIFDGIKIKALGKMVAKNWHYESQAALDVQRQNKADGCQKLR